MARVKTSILAAAAVVASRSAEHDGVAFEGLPDDWLCPRCKQPKDKYSRTWA